MKRNVYSLLTVFLLLGIGHVDSGFAAAPDPAGIAAAKKEGQCVVYTTGRRDIVDKLAKMYEQKYGFPVQVTEKSSAGITQMLEAERRSGKIRCDAIEVGSPGTFLAWKKLGFFQEFVPRGMSEVIPKFRPTGKFEKFFTPKFLNIQSIGYNTRQVKATDVPKMWEDLVNPKWKGKICFPDPRSASPGRIIVEILRVKYGWGFLEKLANMDLTLVGTGLAIGQNLVIGESAIGAPMIAHDVLNMKKKGEPVDDYFPNFPDGTTVSSFNYVGIMKEAAHPNAAKLWIEQIVSAEAQTEFSKVGYMPVRADVPNPYAGRVFNPLEPNWEWLEDHEIEQANKFISLKKK